MKTLFILLTIALQATLARADMPSTHGMLLFGKNATYASHLPMFHAPHDYQVIMKVSLSSIAGTDAVTLYMNAPVEQIFTLVPEKMDLTKVISGEIQQFTALLFEGHFEKGGKNLGQVLVKVEKFILSAKLDPAGVRDHIYILFGEQGEYFAAHIVKGAPSYDTLVQVSQPMYEKPGHNCRVIECNTLGSSLPIADENLPVTIPYTNNQNANHLPVVGSKLGFFVGNVSQILKVIYFEEDELSH